MSLVTPARVAAEGMYFQVIGRLRPGVTHDQARAERECCGNNTNVTRPAISDRHHGPVDERRRSATGKCGEYPSTC